MISNVVDKLLGSLKSGSRISFASRAIGDITLDVTTSEIHGSNLVITENPVEDGSVIADHAVLEPKEISITGVVVDYEPKDSYIFVNSVSSLLRGNLDFLDVVGTLVDLKNKTAFSLEKIKQEALDFANDFIDTEIRKIAPQLPSFMPTIFSDLTSADDNRIAKVYAEFLACQKSGEPITIQTGLCAYSNMLITGMGVSQDKDTAAEFSITLRELFIVETQVIDGVSVPQTPKTSPKGKKQSGKAGKQGASKEQKGKTNPPKKDQSILGKVLGKK